MSTETKATLEADNVRLQSRVEELEAQLTAARRETRKATSKSESDKLIENTFDDASDEASKLLHAMAHAFVEQLRSAADVVKTVADEAFKRNEARSARSDKSLRDRLTDIEDDVAGVVNKGIEKTLATPRRVVDKFHEVYHESAAN